MELVGIFLIAIGLFGIIFGRSPSTAETEVLSKLDEIKSSSSVRLMVIDDKKLNIGLTALGIILLIV